MRFNNNFDTLWTKIVTKDTIAISTSKCIQTNDGGYMFVGSIQVGHPYNNLEDILLIKTDSLGNILWQKSYNYGPMDRGYNIVQTPDKGYLIGGYTCNANNDYSGDPLVLKTDSVGNLIWIKTFGSKYMDNIAIVDVAKDSNYIVGTFYATYQLLHGASKGVPNVLKLKPDGSIIWNRKYSSVKIDFCTQIIKVTPDNNIILTGTYCEKDGGYSSVILKANQNGDSIWMREHYRYFKISLNYLQDINQTKDKGYIACGYVVPNPPDTGYESSWILKIDSLGCDSIGCQLMDNVSLIKELKDEINIYPNPANNEITIEGKEFRS